MKRPIHRIRQVAAGAALALVLSGCGMLGGGVYDTPLPGGADVGSDPITISADFSDVLDLVPQAAVKVDNVPVGRVSSISLNDDGRTARVVLLVHGDTELPAGTQARLRQSSLLGEKYVALMRPAIPGAGRPVDDGTHLGLSETSQAAEVEEVLGALSMVLNGGGIGQFQEISRELQAISTDRPEDIKGFLRQMRTFVGGLDERKEAVTTLIDNLADLSATLEGDKDKIVRALDGLSPGMQVLADQRKDLVRMMKSLDKLAVVTNETLEAAQDDIVKDFKLLEPILAQLAKAGEDLPNALQILLTYPFPDEVLGAIQGDYLNVFITTNFRTLPDGCAAIGCAWPQVGGSARSIAPGAKAKAGKQGKKAKKSADEPTGAKEPAPSLLPPTDSPSPGYPSPTIVVPSPSASASGGPSDGPTGDPSAGPSDGPSGDPSGNPGAEEGSETPEPDPSVGPSAKTTPTTKPELSPGRDD